MNSKIKRILMCLCVAIVFAVTLCTLSFPVMADKLNGLTVAPMSERMIINPGDSFQSSFRISNPVDSKEAMEYELSVEPFYTKNGGELVFEKDDVDTEHTQMVNWVEFNVPTKGKLEPNETKEIMYTVNVPKSAPAGGQYVMIGVSTAIDNDSDKSNSNNNSNAQITEVKRMAHLIYAEVTGETIRQGDIYDASVPSFLFDGDIKGSATIKNNGNVHGDAKYSLQVFPLFSNEEVYSNEEDPITHVILPGRDYYAEIVWEDTPTMGIYNVIFTVEFEGETQEVKKMVIKMPMWMVFLIVLVIATLIIWITMKVKNKGKKQARVSSAD